MLNTAIAISTLCLLYANPEPPAVELTQDDMIISQSCRIHIPEGTVIEDTNDNGVILIAASDISVEFISGSVLRGSPEDTRPDEYRGYAIRLKGYQNVTITGATISGYWCALWATDAGGLTLTNIDASDNRRAYLKSTPAAEDGGDWLFPHQNDNLEWLKNYAAAIYIEKSDQITVHDCRVYNGQNALIIDRVNDSRIYDNDFSFNSGWGLAMWRSSRNVITRNAFDFCVRGYSHGVYNRGQDSAGILMFEQDNDNVLAENSATHGGDCFFGHAGKEALAAEEAHPLDWYKRRGCNGNLLINNDFSYAPAHGIEMTFSFDNRFIGNRMVGNAICGIWGGYSQDTIIAGNEFTDNGEMGYGLERGGVNIEHGCNNVVVDNKFRDNKCGVHFWWDPDENLLSHPWAKANGAESTKNVITANEFVGDKVALHFRGKSDVTLGKNVFKDVEKKIDAEPVVEVNRDETIRIIPELPDYQVYGNNRPIGARSELRGRENIIMTEWGPWDHKSPLVRKVADTGAKVVYELHQFSNKPKIELIGGRDLQARLDRDQYDKGLFRYEIETAQSGVYPYLIGIKDEKFDKEIGGTLISCKWDLTFFKWDENVDPREKLDDWRKLAQGPTAVSAQVPLLAFKFGFGGPSDLKISDDVTAAKLGGDRFGLIATTEIPLPAGKWKFSTTSDDGVRVMVDDQAVIENWTWHAPTPNTGTFELAAPKTVKIVVEHFEIDGFAVLELGFAQKD